MGAHVLRTVPVVKCCVALPIVAAFHLFGSVMVKETAKMVLMNLKVVQIDIAALAYSSVTMTIVPVQ